MATDEPQDVADIHSRLDEIARQIGVIQRATAEETAAGPDQPPPAAPSAPLSLQAAIAEVAARQSELDRAAPPPRSGSGRQTYEPDFSSLHQQLLHITSQIDALRPTQDIEQLIGHFRTELADIRKAVTEAVPSHAIEALQHDIRDLARRINERRDSGGDATTLAGIERTLTDIREALLGLTPAEQLAGFDDAIHGLNRRLDTITRTSDDPASVHQLEEAITALRSVVANIASTETLERLSADVQALGVRIDELAQPVAAMGIAGAGSDAFPQLEQRILTLLERLEATNARCADLSRVETDLSEVLARLEHQRASLAALQQNAAHQGFAGDGAASDPALMETIKRELSDIRYSQSESDRQTQDALEAVHATLGHVVDRLALIEDDLRKTPAAPAPAMALQTLPPRPELPNPVGAVRTMPPPDDGAASRHDTAGDDIASYSDMKRNDAPDDRASRGERAAFGGSPVPAPIDPALPPDHPLEPGSRLPGLNPAASVGSASSTDGDVESDAETPASTPDFIAAARRAAQAAAAAAPETQTRRLASLADATRKALTRSDRPQPAAEKTGGLTTRIRSLLVGTGIVVVALGGFKIATMMIDAGGEIELTAPISLDELERAPEPSATAFAAPMLPRPTAPSITSPTPLEQQSRGAAGAATPFGTADHDDTPTSAIGAAAPTAPATAAAAAQTVGAATRQVSIPASETLPDGIGGPGLRAAALRGHPAAAYQIGMRYAEGKGVAISYDEAFKWHRRAAEGGVIPAMFRLGTFYEKGLGVKKDLDAARTQYQRAADRGNAKAMHNLAVLYADGGGNGADYRTAAEWFRKAAARGIADSQYNLAILYARGIGVAQNLAESYKWFSLAAAQGDGDAGHKRDEIAQRLDAQSLAAARLAVQTFVTERQPDEAVDVPAPAGGWEAASRSERGARTAAARPATR